MIFRNAVRTLITVMVIALGLVVHMGSALANLPMQDLAPTKSVPYKPLGTVTEIGVLYQRATDPLQTALLQVEGSTSCKKKLSIPEQDMEQHSFNCQSGGNKLTLTNNGDVTLRVGVNDISL